MSQRHAAPADGRRCRHGGIAKRCFDTAKIERANEYKPHAEYSPKTRAQFAAFYGDTLHEVVRSCMAPRTHSRPRPQSGLYLTSAQEPVVSGARVTLSYVLRYPPLPAPSDPLSAAIVAEARRGAAPGGEDVKQPPPASAPITATAPAKAAAAEAAPPAKKQRIDLEPAFTLMSAAELKASCRARGLPVTGNKEQLVRRLLDAKRAERLAAAAAAAAAPATVAPLAAPSAGAAPLATTAGSSAALLPLQDTAADRCDPATSTRKALAFAAALRKALLDPAFMPRGGPMGVSCMHLYEADTDLPRGEMIPSAANASGAAARLKGSDAIVSIVCARLGLAVEAVTFACLDDCGDGLCVRTTRLLTRRTARGKVPRKLVPSELARSVGGLTHDNLEGMPWCLALPCSGGPGPRGVVLDDFWCSNTGYFGNEASPGTLYAHAGLVIRVPPVAQRTARMEAMAPDAFRGAFEAVRGGAAAPDEAAAAAEMYRGPRDPDEEDEDESDGVDADSVAPAAPALAAAGGALPLFRGFPVIPMLGSR